MDTSSHITGIIAFVKSANTGSFTAAAKILNITPAAISKNVAALEQNLGVRLFNRTTRSLSLTAEGENFLANVAPALSSLDNAIESVNTQDTRPTGLVRMSVSNVIGRKLLMPIIPALLETHPELRVEIDFDDHIIDFVQEGYDLVIRAGNIHDSSMISRYLGELKRCLVASPAYLAQYGIPQHPTELNKHRLISRRFLGNRVLPWRFTFPEGSVYLHEPTGSILTLSDPGTLVNAALEGLGIAETAVYLAWSHLQKGDLKLVLFEQHDPGDFQMMVQYPHRSLIAPRVRACADFIQQALQKNEALNIKPQQMIQWSALS
ncbi:LysR family transcriptional regulator [Tolumonas lignilytica]|uniref:LysR family transcriptional regulator n=1 Tax=Tolumonas lignilytica TaxID=1283284 RepID=UPI0004651B19|nr:LysR family transcriptional regulator [Tolumonas lignilytica]